jgi:hypothetical protein
MLDLSLGTFLYEFCIFDTLYPSKYLSNDLPTTEMNGENFGTLKIVTAQLLSDAFCLDQR